MCGLVGFLGESKPESELRHIAEQMAFRIEHRGPDDAGTFVDSAAGLGMGFRRLSIIDLSPNGHQPMESASGRYVLTVNGEIYNYRELKDNLPASAVAALRGQSDTEVLLEHIDAFGFARTLESATGMFALALWDRKEKTLFLARDRFGEKPLYYGWVNGVFYFASELKAFYSHPSWKGDIDRDSLSLLLRHGYIPDPYSIFKGIHKLTPGSWLAVPMDQRAEPANFNPRANCVSDGRRQPKLYWNLIDVAERGEEERFRGNEQDALVHLDHVLKHAIGNQMISDRPLGAFLSGGTDSSLIVSLMQSCAQGAVKTFTIGFTEEEFNEAHDAKAVASHLGTEHHELYLTMDEAREVIPILPTIYDEPFADVSQIPTYLVARMAKQNVTVSLSGDGADELFGGYLRYGSTHDLWNSISRYPKVARRALSKIVTRLPNGAIDAALFAPRLMSRKLGRLTAQRAKLATELADSASAHALHLALVSAWQQPNSVVIGGAEPHTVVSDPSLAPCLSHLFERLMLIDSLSVLPGDLLVKMDRAAMAVSLETRCPYLDHHVADFAWSLPLTMKIREGDGKWILKQLLYKYVPRAIVDRPKRGFSVPVRHWLRGPLKEWAADLLSEERLKSQGFFDHALVRRAFQEHQLGQINNEHLLWPVLMFETWAQSHL